MVFHLMIIPGLSPDLFRPGVNASVNIVSRVPSCAFSMGHCTLPTLWVTKNVCNLCNCKNLGLYYLGQAAHGRR